MDVLKDQLVMSGVEFTEKLFKTEDMIDGLSGEVFVSMLTKYGTPQDILYCVHQKRLWTMQ